MARVRDEAVPPGDDVPADDQVPAPDDHSDELPEDLDVTAYVGPYLFPSMRRRRIPAAMYAVLAVACLLGWFASGNGGLLGAAVFLGLVSAYHLACAWPLFAPSSGLVALWAKCRREFLISVQRWLAGQKTIAESAEYGKPGLCSCVSD